MKHPVILLLILALLITGIIYPWPMIGTREWVVYNPKDEHQVYSHASWLLLLSPRESEIRQGWYATEPARQKHWKSFYFD